MQWKSTQGGDTPPSAADKDIIGLFMVKDKRASFHAAIRIAADKNRTKFVWELQEDGGRRRADDEIVAWLEIPSEGGGTYAANSYRLDCERVQDGASPTIKILSVQNL
jgi:hypothetical protein